MSCGLVRVDPFPTKEQLDRYYRQVYNQYRYSFNVPLSDPSRRKLRYLKAVEKFHPRGRLLDVGCAYGHFLENARFNGWRVEGVEPLNDARILAQSRFRLTVHETIDSAPTGVFDAVTLWHVIEHLPAPQETLRSLHARLVRGGILALATPNIESLSAHITGASWGWLSPPDHVILYSRRTLALLLEQSGFEVLHIETARGPARNILLLCLQGIAYRLGLFRQMKASVQKAVYEYQSKRTLRSRLSLFLFAEKLTEGLTFLLTPLIALLWKMGLGDEVLIVARKR
jgi:2-polyprenyl-3-methyl-5-hydroxy-6-metoxy-1,4-benzoquinol methylase